MTISGLGGLYFGKAAAENEVAENPDRFLDTYLDKWSLLSSLETHSRFLVLGPKGTGKSAAAHFVRLSWERQHGQEHLFSNFVDFDELNRTQSPLTSLDKRLVGDVSALTDAAWRLFIGVRILDSMLKDAACSLTKDPQVMSFAAELRSAGLASDDFPQVLRRVRERRGKISLPKLAELEGGSTDSEHVPVNQLGDALFCLTLNAKTPNRHLLAIDGLDKAIGDNLAYWQTLAALIRVVDSFARTLRSGGFQHLYVVVLCRSDVFRRVRFSDAAKIAADGAIHMDWGAEADNPRDTLLWDYVAKKAGVSQHELFALLPEAVRVGQRKKVAIRQFLLQVTRYTPRDISLLFDTLQQYRSKGRLSSSEVRRAGDTFASRYLLNEIMSEATGLLPETMIDRFEQVVGSLPARIFSRSDLKYAMTQAGFDSDKEVNRFAEYLFLQGAIGNYLSHAQYVQFYHRRDAYKWRKDGPWILHTGLVYAFNIPWRSAQAVH